MDLKKNNLKRVTEDEKLYRNGWFVCAVTDGYEYIVVDEIKALIEQDKWQGLIRDVFIPMEEVVHKNGTKRNKVMTIYKRNVFIDMILTQDVYHAIKEVRGFRTPLPAKEPTPVPIEQLKSAFDNRVEWSIPIEPLVGDR